MCSFWNSEPLVNMCPPIQHAIVFQIQNILNTATGLLKAMLIEK